MLNGQRWDQSCRRHLVVWQRLVVKEDDDDDLIVHVRYRAESRESVEEVDSDVSSTNEGNTGPAKDDAPIIGIPWGTISLDGMSELMLRYKVPPNYIYRISGDDEYVLRASPLEVVICEESF